MVDALICMTPACAARFPPRAVSCFHYCMAAVLNRQWLGMSRAAQILDFGLLLLMTKDSQLKVLSCGKCIHH